MNPANRAHVRQLAAAAVIAACATGGVAVANTTSAPVTGGTITFGVGGDGVTLGMSRAQVIATLGKPVYENRNGYMQYGPKSLRNLFDVYRNGGGAKTRVRLMIISGEGSSFRLKDGTAIFAATGLKRIARTFGSRLHYVTSPDNGPSYQLHTTLHGRKVTTSLNVNKTVAQGGRIFEVDIFYA